jgi:aspartate/methionine/tyrosine aminotransferase
MTSQFLGSEDLTVHSKGFLMNKPPHVRSVKDLHQDGAYFDHRDRDADVVTAWIPLQPVDEANGTLQVLHGSHRWGPLPHSTGEATLDLEALDRGSFTACELDAGGVVLADKNLVHYSDSNRGSTARRALIFRYRKTPATRRSPQRRVNGSAIGGGPSQQVVDGEEAAHFEKRHLVLNRVMAERARAQGMRHLDLGSDYHYPFYGDYEPTRKALAAVGANSGDLLHYPSSYGLIELRAAITRFAARQMGVELDVHREVMVTTGASQAFDALGRALSGRYVLIPDLSLPTVATIARGNGAALIRVPINRTSGLMDLDLLQTILDNVRERGESVRFVYLNSPCNPNGAIAGRDYLARLVAIGREFGALLLHDMDSWHTRHVDERVPNVLEVAGARDCAVSLLSISKEFGLPGARVGFLVGNATVVQHVRVHNSVFCVMIPEVCQHAALAALGSFEDEGDRARVDAGIREGLAASVDGWTRLGWPEAEILRPDAGFKYLIATPPRIVAESGYSPTERPLRHAAAAWPRGRVQQAGRRACGKRVLSDETRLRPLRSRQHSVRPSPLAARRNGRNSGGLSRAAGRPPAR